MNPRMIRMAVVLVAVTLITVEVNASEDSERNTMSTATAGKRGSDPKPADNKDSDHGSGDGEDADSDKYGNSNDHEFVLQSVTGASPQWSDTKVPILRDDERVLEEKTDPDAKYVGSSERVIVFHNEQMAFVNSAGGDDHDSSSSPQTDPHGHSHKHDPLHEPTSEHVPTDSGHESAADQLHAKTTNHVADSADGDLNVTEHVTHGKEVMLKEHNDGNGTNQLVETDEKDAKVTTTGASVSGNTKPELNKDSYLIPTDSETDSSEEGHHHAKSTIVPSFPNETEKTHVNNAEVGPENANKVEDPVSITEGAASELLHNISSSGIVSTERTNVTTKANNIQTGMIPMKFHNPPVSSEAVVSSANETTTEAVPSTTTIAGMNGFTNVGDTKDTDPDQTSEVVPDHDKKKLDLDALDSLKLTKIVFKDGAIIACKVDCPKNGRRPTITCLGPLCNKAPRVTMITCYNEGNETHKAENLEKQKANHSNSSLRRFALPFQWGCGADELESEFKVKEPQVWCDGYKYFGDRWILANSCSLNYRIDRLNSSALQGLAESNYGFITGSLIAIACFGVALLVIKAAIAKQRHGIWFPAYSAIPLKARKKFRRKRQNDDHEPVDVNFDMSE
ncbi:uncharacterized protein LOC111262645 isoform X1 [Varroa jacobsoni]|uniref:uncharacterized protein LOC111262645 isoform X1 n=2 Tax=Varroa jacobsoni TaxID=62625 RepID=UPI000BF56837|nr:uncharacterized protein LOC111262645 isoform X1 [Varroa jacobsoni]XP_022692787.1 uncharacterized protein LOC111262645 isoform X1 [Varroa jacobsoni]